MQPGSQISYILSYMKFQQIHETVWPQPQQNKDLSNDQRII